MLSEKYNRIFKYQSKGSRVKQKNDSKLRLETLPLIKTRYNMDKSHPEYNQLNKRISKETRKDYHTYNSKMIKEIIEDNLNMRVLKVKTVIGKSKIF